MEKHFGEKYPLTTLCQLKVCRHSACSISFKYLVMILQSLLAKSTANSHYLFHAHMKGSVLH